MKIAAISCVRDEVDIIESFVRHTLCFADKLFVVDNGSRDGTLQILVSLINEGLNLELRTFASTQHKQNEAMALVLNNMLPVDSLKFDFALLLDADEFICAESRSLLVNELAKCDQNSYPVMGWKTYIPDSFAEQSRGECITKYMKKRREPEGNCFYKAIVPASMFGHCILGLGNHFVASSLGQEFHPMLIQIPLAHFPIRSAEQTLCKLILGAHTLARKRDRASGEGAHWTDLADKIRSMNYAITPEVMLDFSVYYAQSTDLKFSVVDDPMPVLDGTSLRYSNDSKISVIQRFDTYLEVMEH